MDLPRSVELDVETATTRDAWEQTMAALEAAKGQSSGGLSVDPYLRAWEVRYMFCEWFDIMRVKTAVITEFQAEYCPDRVR